MIFLVQAQGATCLDYEVTIPAKFMVGTEQGLPGSYCSELLSFKNSGNIFYCNRKAKSIKEKFETIYKAHSGAICGLQRNPLVPKVCYYVTIIKILIAFILAEVSNSR